VRHEDQSSRPGAAAAVVRMVVLLMAQVGLGTAAAGLARCMRRAGDPRPLLPVCSGAVGWNSEVDILVEGPPAGCRTSLDSAALSS
jgi:hypothetical protein